MTKLWQKTKTKTHPLIEQYTAAQDCALDEKLMLYDILASKAHAKGLCRIGIITQTELQRLLACLAELENKFKQRKIKITARDEDCHTVIENYLTKKLGDIGKKIHTGRSRNDQVLVALHLYMKKYLLEIQKQVINLAVEFLQLAKKYQHIPLPGYTHTQQAMLTSLGHYLASFTESLLDDSQLTSAILEQIDKNPLGSAAGYGVPLPLDREFVAKELGFAQIQINSLYCQNSRGKFASLFLEALSQIMLTIGRFANDLILFTSTEFNFFSVDNSLTTGSSIMPQKKNLDALELLRANVSMVIGYQEMTKNISKNLVSGYNRDLQLIKKLVMDSVPIVIDSLRVAKLYLSGIKPQPDIIKEKIKKEIFASDVAYDLVKKNHSPFRDAYQQALDKLAKKNFAVKQIIKARNSLGAPGNLNLKYYEKKIQQLKRVAV